jgi:HNH endonuclease
MKAAVAPTQQLIQRLLEQQQGQCFICQKPIDPDVDAIEVDHIMPRARGGKDDENNYAATHEWCNRTKSDADLRVARSLAKYEQIKDKCAVEDPKRPHLGDFLNEFGGGKFYPNVSQTDKVLTVSLPEKGQSSAKYPVHRDKLSGFDYVFLNLPIEYLHHDDRINPRAVGGRIRGLLSEFLSGKPQLHVSLAWGVIENGKLQLKVFDGQHKAVAQMLLGVRELPVRLFINPDLKVLLEANTNAGTSLRQVAFDQATQRYLGSQLYWEKIDEFRTATNKPQDDLSFSEQDLVNLFRGERREVTKYILDDVRIGIIHHPDNKLKDFVEFSGREGEKPLRTAPLRRLRFRFSSIKSRCHCRSATSWR